MSQVKQLPKRQRIRMAILIISFLLLPVTLYYFSPAVVLGGAAEGVVNASLVVFGLLFLSSLFLGRLWCGWACPAGGLQEICAPVNRRSVASKLGWIKWGIWIPWMGGIIALAAKAGGYHSINLLYNLEGGATLAIPPSPQAPPWYAIYYIILALFAGLALFVGRRAGCHTVCWMAPFMILGRKFRNAGRWPALQLQAEPEQCADCRACTRNCPMGLDVHGMVRSGDMEHTECILCGTCVDNCKKSAIRYSFGPRP